MAKERQSKLDQYAERLAEWDAEGKTLEAMREQLRLDGCSVSSSRISDFLTQLRDRRLQDKLLGQIASGARQASEVEKAFGESPAPELETIIKLQRVLIMKLSTQAVVDPEMIELVARLTKPTMEYAKLIEKRREIELAEEKYRDQVRQRKEALDRELHQAKSTGGISPETFERIERELKLL